jgi:hypothetical protein
MSRAYVAPPGCPRPALAVLIAAMAKLSRTRRQEIIARGRKAKAAKEARIRKLTRAVTAEVRRLAAEASR